MTRRELRRRKVTRLSIIAICLFSISAFGLFAGAYCSDNDLGHVSVLVAWGVCFFSLVAGALCLGLATEA